MVHQCVTGCAPQYLASLFVQTTRVPLHDTQTAATGSFHVPKARSEVGKKSFNCFPEMPKVECSATFHMNCNIYESCTNPFANLHYFYLATISWQLHISRLTVILSTFYRTFFPIISKLSAWIAQTESSQCGDDTLIVVWMRSSGSEQNGHNEKWRHQTATGAGRHLRRNEEWEF